MFMFMTFPQNCGLYLYFRYRWLYLKLHSYWKEKYFMKVRSPETRHVCSLMPTSHGDSSVILMSMVSGIYKPLVEKLFEPKIYEK